MESILEIYRRDPNYFGTELKPAPNYIFLVVYAFLFIYIILMSFKSRYWWFNVTFFCCFGMEMIGFIGRVLALGDPTNFSAYVMQTTCLTIAPVFIMAGIYVIIGQLIVYHGNQFSIIKPITYSYFFITMDVISFFIQAAGGGLSSNSSSNIGFTLFIIGVSVQLAAMTLLLGVWFHFLYNIFFKYCSIEKYQFQPSFGNYFRMLFNVPSARVYKLNQLDEIYNPQFTHVRARRLFTYMPLMMTIAILFVYIRCIYRVVELSEGWNGYLMTHEVYLMVLDSAMIAAAGLIFVVFHPYWVYGNENVLTVKDIKQKPEFKSLE